MARRQESEHGRRGGGSAFDGRRRPPALLAAHGDAAQIDHRVFDDASAHPAGRAPRPLPRPLLHPSRHAEQVDGALRRLRQFPVPVQARDVLDGGAAILHLRHHRRHLQSAHRLHRRALRAQRPEPRPAQVARHAVGALGDPAGDELSRLAMAVRSFLQRVQLALAPGQHRSRCLDRRRQLGALLRHSGQCLDRRAVLHDHVSGGAEIGSRAALRGGGDRRRQLVAAHVVRDAAHDAQHHGHHRAVFPDRDLRQFRHRAHPDRGRADRSHARVRHLGVLDRHSGQRHSARRQRLAVHGARHPSPRERNVMTAAAITTANAPARKRRYGSMSRDRRWALRWSYFFLTVFAIFFLMPPVYMLITSLKTSAEISAATNPWWVYHPTLGNYVELLTSSQYLTFFRNSALVSVIVVAITMLISVPAAFALSRMRFWGSAALATGIFLTYLIPETLLFIPLFKMFALVNEYTGIQLINRWWVLLLLYPTLTVPFCTWIMIGYFASIPKELDEAALMDGANYRQILTRVFIPVALPGLIAATIFAFTVSWAQFLYPLAFTTSADQLVLPVGIVTSLIKGDVFNWGQIMTGALLGAAPPLIIYAFLMDYYIAGLTAGATKG